MSQDSQLIERLRQGEVLAGDELVDRYGGPLVRYFQSMNPEGDTAEDLANETFLRFIRAVRAPVPPTIRSLPAFLFTIARNLMADQRKQAARRPRMVPIQTVDPTDPSALQVESVDPRPNPREAAIAAEERRLVRSAIEELEPKVREVLLLRHVEGLTCPEIAGMLGMREGTVWSHLHRGLQAVRRRLTPRPATAAPANEPAPRMPEKKS